MQFFCIILHEIIAVPDGICIYGPYMNTVFKPNVPSQSDLSKKHSSRSEKARFWSQFSCSLCMLCQVLILPQPQAPSPVQCLHITDVP